MRFVIAILVFASIILFHEYGHYLAAKKCGVRVNEFMIGLGPRLFGIHGKETLFSVHLLPFGGACVMEGEDSESDDPRAFNNKSVFRRFLIVAAGPVFNFILAFLLSIILIACTGYVPSEIGRIKSGYPAEQAGLKSGDVITDINGYSVHSFNDITAYQLLHKGKKLHITVRRGVTKLKRVVTPEYNKKAGTYLIGIESVGKPVKGNIFTIISKAFWQVRYVIYVTIGSLGLLFTGGISLNDLSGPVGIIKAVGDAYQSGLAVSVFYALMDILDLTILLSANLGVMNLLPLPALDGGRLLLYIVEMIRRKKAPEKVEGYVNLVGFALLMALMVLVMGNDIRKLFFH